MRCVAVVKKRVPLFIGVTSVNSREAVEKIKSIDDSGADGILLGVPYYFPSSLENAIRFYRDIGEMFPQAQHHDLPQSGAASRHAAGRGVHARSSRTRPSSP